MTTEPENILRIVGLLCAGLFLLAFGAGGIFMIVSYFRNKKKTAGSQSWTSTSGTIQESDIRESTSSDFDGPATYYAHVLYTYQVMGQSYQSKNIHIGARSAGPRSKAQQVASRYPIGAAVTVFYDPGNPADAVLERSAPANTVTLILGIIFLMITLCLSCGAILSLLTNWMAGSGV